MAFVHIYSTLFALCLYWFDICKQYIIFKPKTLMIIEFVISEN